MTIEEYNKFDILSQKDLMTLSPGEAFSLRIDIANARYYDINGRAAITPLRHIPGVYNVLMYLALYDGNAPDWYLQKGWSGSVESNTVKVVVENRSEQQRINMPAEDTKK